MDAERLTLFQQLLQKKGISAATKSPGMKKRLQYSPCQLSFAQQRLWFIHQVEQGLSLYHKPCGLHLSGSLDKAAMEHSINTIIQRHEVLRTVFSIQDGQPVQTIREHMRISLVVVDLSQLAVKPQEQTLSALAAVEIQKPFDLEQGPLVRAVLYQLQEQEYILLITMHHIVTDDWSVSVFLRELTILYRNAVTGQAIELPALPIQYADYALWQRDWLQGEVLARQLNYWKKQLYEAPPTLDLPTDFARPAVQKYQGAYYPIRIPQEVSIRLKELAYQQKTTLFVVLLAAFQTLLYRYSGQDDVVVGSTVANRTRVELENLIGFFINTLVLRTDFSENPTFLQLVKRVREVALEGYSHQDIPFEKLVEELQPVRDLSRTPLFQVVFILHNVPLSEPNLPHLMIKPFQVESKTVHFDLTLSLEESEQGICGEFGYNTHLFVHGTIERFATSFSRLLSSIVQKPEQPIANISLVIKDELLGGKTPGPSFACLHTLITEQATRTPNSIALFWQEHMLSYGELDRRSNQVAHYLLAHGVQSETLVGIYADRSLEMVIGLLGILKAGGAYVPLDSSQSRERLPYMLDEVQVILTQTQYKSRIESLAIHIGCLDDASLFANLPTTFPATHVLPEQLAYVIYTSGSTGKPKGVMIEHRQIVQYVLGITKTLKLATKQHFALVSTFAADLGHTMLFPALCAGKSLHILSQEQIIDPEALGSYFCEHSIDTVKIVPTHLMALLLAREPARVLPSQHLILGGESSYWEWVEKIRQIGSSSITITNHYGPTETTVGALTYTVTDIPDHPRTIQLPIGKPLPGVEAYILDRYGQPVPSGAVGELYIGGNGLARGYLNQPEWTAERFIPDMFSHRVGARLYRTGDKARYSANGDIEFLGRRDQQVKIRGFRVEIGEIEAILGQHPLIYQAVVIAQEEKSASGEKRLFAYLVTYSRQEISSIELRQYLRERLPDYMIPSAFVQLTALPLTANGKLDSAALPLPERNIAGEQEFQAPRDQIELRLTQIWQEVLGIPSLSITSSFFELGGHSLAIVHLMARIQDAFAQTLPFSALFQNQTIAKLASLLRHGEKKVELAGIVSLAQPDHCQENPLFLIHPIGGNVFCYLELARYLGAERVIYALEAQDSGDRQEQQLELQVLATRYIRLIQKVQPTGAYRLGGWSFGGVVAFEMAHQLRAAGKEIELLLLIDSSALGEDTATQQDVLELLAGFATELGLKLTEQEQSDLQATFIPQNNLEEQLSWIFAQAKQLQIFPADIEQEHIHRLWRIYKANRQAFLQYRPRFYDGTLHLVEAQEKQNKESLHTWDSLARTVRKHTLPGDHYALLTAPDVIHVAHIVSEALKTSWDDKFPKI